MPVLLCVDAIMVASQFLLLINILLLTTDTADVSAKIGKNGS